MLLKRVIKGVAVDCGLRATFMPKPFADFSGNGMHIHMSLEDENGENLFRGQTELGSPLLRSAIGGILDTMPDMFAIYAPGRNSYRRFVADFYVPINRTWGYNNRSVTIRIPTGADASRRLEHRIAGADANPYLVLGALLASVHYGITHQVDPGKAADQVNVSNSIDESLPLEWSKAIDCLRASTFAQEYFTQEYIDLYCELKRAEVVQFNQHITDQEYRLYL